MTFTYAPEIEIPVLPPNTHITVLDNGLAVVTREDHSAPVVSAQVWCKSGSIHEGEWLGAGLSHTLEHMLFKGTTTRGASRIDQEIQEAGGYMNAYTSFDRTVYWINVPNTGTAIALDILADIVQHATLPADEMIREKQVILREMDMNQDDPGRRSSRRLFETAYTVSPYRYTVIGYPDIFNEVQRDDIVAYYRAKYTPHNLFFVVVGDFKTSAVLDQIRTAFDHARGRGFASAVLPVEPLQAAQREVVEEAPIELGHLHIAWHIPDIRHADIPALDVLSTLLGIGHSSRLYQRVREQLGLAHCIDAWTYNPGNPGLLGMSAVVDADRFEAARAAMLAEIDRMKHEPVAAPELTKAVKQFMAATLAVRKTMQGQAQDLGSNWIAASDLNFSERYLAAVKRVTPEDLQRVARTYLTTNNRTVYALLPQGTSPTSIESTSVLVDLPFQKTTLPNGLTLLIKEDHRLPFAYLRVVFRGGVLAETPQTNGLTLLLSKMLLKGTKSRAADQIVTEIESLGGAIDSYSGNSSLGLSAEVLSSDFAAGLDLLSDILLHPVFPETALQRERETQLAGIRNQRDQLLQSASRAMRHALFGDHGYGLDIHGTEECVSTLSLDALRDHYEQLIRPNNAVLSISGDIDAVSIRNAVDAALSAWPPGPAWLKPAQPFDEQREVLRLLETRDKRQAVIVIGFPGATLFDPDRYALDLLQEALSDLGSRLFMRIREQLGLAYYVGAQNFLGMRPGYFAFYAGTAPEKAALVEAELLKEAEALCREGLTIEELQRAKAKLIGQKKISRQDLGGFSTFSALDELYGLGFAHTESEDERFSAVTLETMQTAIRKYLLLHRAVIAVVKPPDQT